MGTLVVTAKGVYGRELFYPANVTAEQFAELLGAKALTRAQLERVKALGFQIVTVVDAAAQI